VNVHQFTKLFSKHLEWWPMETEEQQVKLFNWFDKDKSGLTSFVEYTIGLNVVKHGVLLQLQKFAFDMHSVEGVLNQKSCMEAIATVHSLVQSQQTQMSTQTVADNSEDVKKTWTDLADDPEKQQKIEFSTFQKLSHVTARKV